MRVMWARAVMLAVVGTLAACSGGGSTRDLDEIRSAPKCSDVYVEGASASGGAGVDPCIDGDGTVKYLGSAGGPCSDGETLGWNDRGWWKGGVVHEHRRADGQLVPPDDVLALCGR